jgi:hypothetical protein
MKNDSKDEYEIRTLFDYIKSDMRGSKFKKPTAASKEELEVRMEVVKQGKIRNKLEIIKIPDIVNPVNMDEKPVRLDASDFKSTMPLEVGDQLISMFSNIVEIVEKKPKGLIVYKPIGCGVEYAKQRFTCMVTKKINGFGAWKIIDKDKRWRPIYE